MSAGLILGRLVEDRRGDATVQFALLLPALLLFILGALEFAIIIFVSSSLEAAVLLASRYGLTGTVSGNVSREDRIRQIIEERTFGFVDMATAQIHTKVYTSFNNIGQPEPLNDRNNNGVRDAGETYTDTNGNGRWDSDMGVAGVGGPSDIVLYEIEYRTRSMTGFLDPIIGEFTHKAAVAVRNEPP